jgi:hypothetical protein
MPGNTFQNGKSIGFTAIYEQDFCDFPGEGP